ncbi:MAG: hypothetical protein M3496_10985 [Pseudomonadota bacterium]|nr:hypothetical protein [Pseudomonadota bacterium]
MIRAFAGLIVLSLLALPLRTILAHPLSLSALPSLQVDSAAYDAIAAEVARTRSLDVIPPLQPPGFVLTIAAVYALWGHSWIAAKVFLWLVLVACAAMSARLAWRVDGDGRHAWVAALLTAAAPAMHGYTATIQYEVLAAGWLLLLVLLTDRARAGHAGICALLGLCAAAATLTREVLVVTVPVLATVVAHQQYRSIGAKRAIACSLIFAACATAPVAAWAMLQTGRSGRVVAISDKGPLVMAFGNNPRANGTFNAPLAGVAEPSGLAFIRSEPARFIELSGRKFLYFWGVLRDGWNVPRPSAIWVARSLGGTVPLQWLLPLVRGGWLLVVVAIALVMWRRSTWRHWWMLPALVLSVLCVHLVTVSSYRFAVPLLPILFAIAAAPIVRTAQWLRASRYRYRACVMLVVAFVAMQTGDWPLRYELMAAQTDGLDVTDVVDAAAGVVRVADAARGRRAAMLLSDEALSRGTFDVVIRMKALADVGEQPIAKAWLQTDAAVPICERVIGARESAAGEWFNVEMSCTLRTDTVATIVVETTGVADVAFESLRLRW